MGLGDGLGGGGGIGGAEQLGMPAEGPDDIWGQALGIAGMGRKRPNNLAAGIAANAARDRQGFGGSMGYNTYPQMGGSPFGMGGSPFGMGRRGGFPGGGGGGYGGQMGGGDSSDLLRYYADAQRAASMANQQRYSDILGSYNKVINQSQDMVNRFSNQGKTDINNQYNAYQANSTQSLINKGLGNTTVTSSVGRGVEADRSTALNHYNDQMLAREHQMLTQPEMEGIHFQERANVY